jgi:hypothetical protein
LIPNGKTASLQVDVGEPVTIPDISLYPVQIPHADLEDAPYGPFVKDEAVYGSDANYPPVFARLDPVQIARGQRMAVLWIYPFKYNPLQRTLEKYPNLTVTVTFEGSIEPIPARLISKEFEAIYRNLALNADAVLSAEKVAAGTYELSGKYGYDYLIITTSKFLPAANKLAAWRTLSGFKTSVNPIPSTWKAADIKSALQGAYDNWKTVPRYVLLLGDAEYIPTNYVTDHPFNQTLHDGQLNSQGLTGTDFYYSTLHSINPTDPNADYWPDLNLGRISVGTADEALARVQGIIDYDKSPTTNSTFYNTVTLAAEFQDGGTYSFKSNVNGSLTTKTFLSDGIEDRHFTQTAEDLGIFLAASPQNKTLKRFYYAKSTVSPTNWNDNKQPLQEFTYTKGQHTSLGGAIPPALLRSPGFGWDGDHFAISAAINAGSFLVLQRGHGARDHWGKPYYGINDVKLLDNPSKLPVVWSINCETGWFDNETDFKKKYLKDQTSNTSESLSEWFERPGLGFLGDYGAVGVVASTRVSYSGYNDYLVEGMTGAIWPAYIVNSSVTLGAAHDMSSVLNQAKLYMHTKGTIDDYMTAVIEGMHWFGDPATEIRTEPPVVLSLNFGSKWDYLLHPHPFTFTVEKSGGRLPDTPVEGAKVTVSKASQPQDYWVGVTNAGGELTFPDLTTTSLGAYDVVVTAPNAIPFNTTFESESGAAGGIQLDKDVYACFSSIQVKAADANLKSTGTLNGTLVSSAGDSETVPLAEAGDNTGFFTGSLPIAPGAPQVGDGALQLLDGQTITAQYLDADDGAGNTLLITDTAQVDCLPPLFGGLVSVSAEDCSVHLTWEPATDPNGPLLYTIYRDLQAGPPIGNPLGQTWSNSFNDYDCLPGMMRYYVVRARDILGNENINLVELSIATPGIYLPLIRK